MSAFSSFAAYSHCLLNDPLLTAVSRLFCCMNASVNQLPSVNEFLFQLYKFTFTVSFSFWNALPAATNNNNIAFLQELLNLLISFLRFNHSLCLFHSFISFGIFTIISRPMAAKYDRENHCWTTLLILFFLLLFLGTKPYLLSSYWLVWSTGASITTKTSDLPDMTSKKPQVPKKPNSKFFVRSAVSYSTWFV